jgi:hypothetical protein
VHRVLAWLLGPALLATSSAGSPLHVHPYSTHDHPEHRHAPAAHTHHEFLAHPDDGKAHVEPCDAGEHVVSLVFVWTEASQVHVAAADLSWPARPAPALPSWRAAGTTDVRVHGPPPSRRASPRGPPLIALA